MPIKHENKKLTVTITETVTQDFEVEATSEDDALDIARKKYKDCQFVLEPGNLIDVDFKLKED